MTPYESWSLWIQGLTALGTLSAVIVALYLSARRDSPRIAIRAMTCCIHNVAGVIDSQVFVNVNARNQGVMRERIMTFGYEIGIYKWKIGAMVNPSPLRIGTRFNSEIDPGQSVDDCIPIDKFNEMQLEVFTSFFEKYMPPAWMRPEKWFASVAIKTARCWVNPSRGNVIYAPLDVTLRKHILTEYQKQKSGNQPKD